MTTKPSTYLNKPHNQIAKCIRHESITGLLWAFIQLAQHEIKHEGKSETFSGSDLSKFITLLHQREITGNTETSETDVTAIAAWLTEKDTETPKQ